MSNYPGISFLIFVLTMIIKLSIDLKLYESGKRNQHLRGATVVFIVLTGCSWLAGWLSSGIWFMSWWILFNGCYAILIGRNWNYIGTTSYLDIYESKHRWVTPAKYVILLTNLILFICLT